MVKGRSNLSSGLSAATTHLKLRIPLYNKPFPYLTLGFMRIRIQLLININRLEELWQKEEFQESR